MAKYSDIKGFTVQTLSTDTIANQAAGGSWASGGDMNTARRALASAGIQTAAITFGGYTTTQVALNEQYNGSSWTEVGDLNAARHGIRGVGIYTAALAVGGLSPSASALNEIWDGSSWTETGDLNTARGNFAGASGNGTTTAAIVFGGYTSGPGATGTVAINESWDGSSWTEVGDLNNVGSQGPSGVGTSTAAIRASSNTQPSGYAPVENWDGSSWTEGTNMNTNRGEDPGANGTQTDALVYGGFTTPPATTRANTEAWDGTSWTEVTDLSTARYAMTGCGTTGASSALAMGGYLTSNLASTEEWTAPATFNQLTQGQLFFNSTANAFKETILDIAGATWASGGAFPSASVQYSAGAGTQTAAVSVAGYSPPSSSPYTGAFSGVFKYDGTSWSSNPNNYPTNVYGFWGSGTQTAGLFTGGAAPGNIATTNKFDGTSFTSTGDLNSGRRYLASNGTQTASIAAGGYTTTMVAIVEDFDGSSWTETGDMNNARQLQSQLGSSTASLAIGKSGGSDIVESWDGSSWTAVSALNSGRQATGASGTQTYGLAYAGEDSGGTPQAKTEHWNGSTWTEVNDMSNARYGVGSLGFSAPASAVVTWGGATNATSTEEFTVNLGNKTITAS